MRERARVVDVRRRELQLGRQVGREPDDLREQPLDVPRQRLDLGRVVVRVGQRLELADQVRVARRRARRASPGAARRRGSGASRRGSSASCGRPRPSRRRRCRRTPARRSTASFAVTSARKRSPATTSSISRIERSCPIASGIIDCGKTTVSLSARIGSVAGRSISVSSSPPGISNSAIVRSSALHHDRVALRRRAASTAIGSEIVTIPCS